MPTVNDFRKMLLIHKHRLDDEFELQAESQFHIGELMLKAQARYDAAKEKVARVEAELYTEIGSSDEKLSDTKIRMRIVIDPRMEEATERLAVAKHDYNTAFQLHEAWRQRGYALKGLADLYVSNYFSVQEMSTSASEKDYVYNRTLAAKARAYPSPQSGVSERSESAKSTAVAPRRRPLV